MSSQDRAIESGWFSVVDNVLDGTYDLLTQLISTSPVMGGIVMLSIVAMVCFLLYKASNIIKLKYIGKPKTKPHSPAKPAYPKIERERDDEQFNWIKSNLAEVIELLLDIKSDLRDLRHNV